MAELLAALRDDFAGRETPAPAAAQQDAAVWQRRRSRRRPHAARLRGLLHRRRRPAEHARRRLSHQPAADHLPRLLRLGDRRHARRAAAPASPLSEGISPVQGADRHGPTAVLKSAAKMDHAAHRRHAAQPEVHAALLADDDGLDSLVQLVRAYFKLDGHHIQFNVVDAADPARRPGASRAAPRPDRARGRLQRLLLRPRAGAAGRDHRADGAPGVSRSDLS